MDIRDPSSFRTILDNSMSQDNKISLDKVLLDADSHGEFIRRLMQAVVLSTSQSNDALDEHKYNLHAYSSDIKECKLKMYEILNDISRFVDDKTHRHLSDDLHDSVIYDHVIDLVDKLLDDADLRLEELSGQNHASKLASSISMSMAVDQDRLLHEQVVNNLIDKPQLQFYTEIDNSRERAFKPRLTSKPHSQIALDLTERPTPKPTDTSSTTPSANEFIAPHSYYPHPYEYELKNLEYMDWQLEEPLKPKPRSWSALESNLRLIDQEEEFYRTVDELRSCTEIAIDLEHHAVRSFQGLTCLIQISSRTKDYLIDALALRRYLSYLNEITANPTIVKVFHGCESDILWLQKDCGVYVVNCFDSYHAASLLQYPALSLAHLLKIHCNVTTNKRYQLSDWRQRPLSEEMLAYARDDTHYLLHIYDCLRQEVWQARQVQGLRYVLDASKKICLKRYEKEYFWPLGYRKLLDNPRGLGLTSSTLTALQESVLSKLWDWRDLTARKLDESVVYVMSNAELLRIGAAAPRSSQQLHQLGPLSELVIQHEQVLLQLINEQYEIAPSSYPVNASNPVASMNNLGASSERLYGRALKTPSKDLLAGVMMDLGSSPSPSHLLYQPYGQATIATIASATVSSSPPSTAAVRQTMTSPVLFVDDVFKYANWNSGLSTATPAAAPSNSMDDSKQRLASVKKALEKYQQPSSNAVAAEEVVREPTSTAIAVPVATMTAVAPSARESLLEMLTSSNDATAMDEDRMILQSLPGSFSEIYQLSNDLRQKKIDKKRSRDLPYASGTGSADELPDAEPHSQPTTATIEQPLSLQVMLKDQQIAKMMENRMFDENIYLRIASSAESTAASSATSAPTPAVNDLENSLNLVSELGWIRSAEQRDLILQQHLLDASNQASALASNDASGGTISQSTGSRPRSASGSSPGNTLSKVSIYVFAFCLKLTDGQCFSLRIMPSIVQ
jgi:ribonuclease D